MIISAIIVAAAIPQEAAPALRAGALPPGAPGGRGPGSDIVVDGRLDEAAWESAEAVAAFTQVEPAEGAAPTARTRVQVLAGPRAIVIGVLCEDDPARIVSF